MTKHNYLITKTIAATVCAMLAAPFSMLAQDVKRDFVTRVNEAWGTLIGPRPDLPAFQRWITPDYIQTTTAGATWSAEESIANLRACNISSFKMVDSQVRYLSSTSALIVYHAVVDGTCHGHNTPSIVVCADVWHKQGNKWLIQLHNETAVSAKK